jgi:hypothetical protein
MSTLLRINMIDHFDRRLIKRYTHIRELNNPRNIAFRTQSLILCANSLSRKQRALLKEQKRLSIDSS